MSEDQKPPEWAAGIAAAFGKALGWRVAIMVIGFAVTIVGGVYYALEVTVRPLQEQITNNQSTLTAALNNANSTASERLLAIEGSLETQLTAINENITTIGAALARLDERSLTAVRHIEELRVAAAKALDQSNDLSLQLVALNARLEGATFQRQNSPLIQEQSWRQTDDPRFPNGLFQDIDLNDWHVEPMRPLNYLDDDTAPLHLQVSRKNSLPGAPLLAGRKTYELVSGGPYKIGPGNGDVRFLIPAFERAEEMETWYAGDGSAFFLMSPRVCFELNKRFESLSELVELATYTTPAYVRRYDYMSALADDFTVHDGISFTGAYNFANGPDVTSFQNDDLIESLAGIQRLVCFSSSSE